MRESERESEKESESEREKQDVRKHYDSMSTCQYVDMSECQYFRMQLFSLGIKMKVVPNVIRRKL